MGFLNPSILPALGAASIPILIHLLNRQKRKRVYFSSISFLKNIQARRARRIQLRQVLLLALRTLIIIFAVLTFARPTVKGNFKIGQNLRTAAVILLDKSYSMGFETDKGKLLELAKEKASEIASSFKPQDQVILLPFSEGRPQPVKPSKLPRISLSNKTTQAGKALKKAAEILNDSEAPRKELYIITDLQENGWQNVEDFKAEGTTVYIIPLKAPQEDNVSIDKVIFPEQIITSGGLVSLEAEITNHRKKPLSELFVSLYIDGQRTKSSAVSIKAGQSKRVPFKISPGKTGEISGYVKIEADRLLVDNKRYFSLFLPEKIKVILTSGDHKSAYFIKRALTSSDSRNRLIQCEKITSAQLKAQKIRKADVVVLSNLPHLERRQLALLHEHLSRGGGILLSLGPKIKPSYYNQIFLPEIIPLSIGGLKSSPNKNASYSFNKFDSDHPLLKPLIGGNRLKSARFYNYYPVSLSPGTKPLVWYNDGNPALCESKRDKGKVILFTSGVNLNWTDLPVRGDFAPLFYRIIQYLGSSLPGKSYLVGDRASGNLSDPEKPLWCEDSSGRRINLMPSESEEGFKWKLESLETPGIWRVFSGKEEIQRLAVNPDTRESDPSKISSKRLRQIFDQLSVGSIPEQIHRLRLGRELWKHTLGVVLLLLALEALILRKLEL